MPDFDPDAYLSGIQIAATVAPPSFDPDAYLNQQPAFDPDQYLGIKPPSLTPASDAVAAATGQIYGSSGPTTAEAVGMEKAFAAAHPSLYGVARGVAGMIPTPEQVIQAGEEVNKASEHPLASLAALPSDIVNNATQMGKAARGDYGPEAQAQTITQAALMAAPLLHLPFAKAVDLAREAPPVEAAPPVAGTEGYARVEPTAPAPVDAELEAAQRANPDVKLGRGQRIYVGDDAAGNPQFAPGPISEIAGGLVRNQVEAGLRAHGYDQAAIDKMTPPEAQRLFEQLTPETPAAAEQPPTVAEPAPPAAEGTKIVDESGKPLRVYHGTRNVFQEFQPSAISSGIHFAESPETASAYAENFGIPTETGSPNVHAAYLDIKNPAPPEVVNEVKSNFPQSEVKAELIRRGYDGIEYEIQGKKAFVAFHANQVIPAYSEAGIRIAKGGTEEVVAPAAPAGEAKAAERAAPPAAAEAPPRVTESPLGGEPPAPPQEPAKPPAEVPVRGTQADVAVAREKAGLDPYERDLQRSWGQASEVSRQKVQRYPGYEERLAQEIDKKPRPVTDDEHVSLLRNWQQAEVQYQSAVDAVNTAPDATAKGLAETARAIAKDKLEEAVGAVDKSGSAAGRGFNIRKMILKDFYSPERMADRVRAAKGGKALTEGEVSQVERHVNEMRQARVASSKVESQRAADARYAEKANGSVGEKASKARTVKDVHDILNAEAEAARQRIVKERGSTRWTKEVEPCVL